jgi:hypothetical protein
MDLKSASLEEIRQRLGPLRPHAVRSINIGGSVVSRVRRLEEADRICSLADVWCPPAAKAPLGRANRPGAPVFYGAFDPVTAIRETGIKPGERYAVAIYTVEATGPHDDSTVAIYPWIELPYAQSRDQRLVAAITTDFYISEFSRPDVHYEGQSYQHKASCVLAEMLLDLPYRDSLLYQSTLSHSRFNLAMQEEAARERLKLLEVIECRMTRDEGGDEVRSLCLGGYLPDPQGEDLLPGPVPQGAEKGEWRWNVQGADGKPHQTEKILDVLGRPSTPPRGP